MVRVKAKAKKGDDAFQTRKQKVGRKKLAPATATRAEVHARTLRVIAPSAIIRAEAALRSEETQQEERRTKKTLSAEQHHKNFTEHLTGTRHYKKSVRSAAFASIARDIAISSNNKNNNNNSNDVSLTMAEESPALDLSPVELLSAFTSALDAISDTDDDVRRAALTVLRALLKSPSASLHEPSRNALVCDTDRTRTALRVLDVALTHAMGTVRRTGVELLQLLLRVDPKGVRDVLGESVDWVKTAGRVATIVITAAPTMVVAIPSLLEVMLGRADMDSDEARGTDHFSNCGIYGEWNEEEEKEDEENSNRKKNKKKKKNNNNNNNAEDEEEEEECVVKDTHLAVAPLVCDLFATQAPVWATAWRELMELRGALLRDSARVTRATAIARAFACTASYLSARGLLSSSHARLLRELFVSKVPYTMGELSGSGRGLANAIADVCVVIAPRDDAAWRVFHAFLSSSFVSSSSSSSSLSLGPLRTLRAATLSFPDTHLPRLIFAVAPVMRAATSHAAVDAALRCAADIFAALLASPAAARDAAGRRGLSDAAAAVPRLLFALRRAPGAVDGAVRAFLWPLWRAASSGHPALSTTSSSSSSSSGGAGPRLRTALPSLFGIGDGEVEGVLGRCSEETAELAAHVMFYIGGDGVEGHKYTADITWMAETLQC